MSISPIQIFIFLAGSAMEPAIEVMSICETLALKMSKAAAAILSNHSAALQIWEMDARCLKAQKAIANLLLGSYNL